MNSAPGASTASDSLLGARLESRGREDHDVPEPAGIALLALGALAAAGARRRAR